MKPGLRYPVSARPEIGGKVAGNGDVVEVLEKVGDGSIEEVVVTPAVDRLPAEWHELAAAIKTAPTTTTLRSSTLLRR